MSSALWLWGALEGTALIVDVHEEGGSLRLSLPASAPTQLYWKDGPIPI